MATATAIGETTFDDFCLIIKDGEKADLIDGVIYMSSPDNLEANELMGWLAGALDLFVEAQELGKVCTSRVAFRLAVNQGPEPDIAFVSTVHENLLRRGYVAGRPDLAVEIVSPDSVQRDYIRKREQYCKAGVPEYWIVDPMRQRFLLLRLTAKRAYRVVRPRKGVLHSAAVPGFWLRPTWLWQRPRPKKIAVLAEILGE